MKCDCGITIDGKVFVCPIHIKRLMEDSYLAELFNHD